MKILIINGYQDTKEGLKAFLGFRYLIQKIFMEQIIIIDMDTEFVIRKINELDDILYESTSTSIKVQSGRNFDNFDMIFVTGEPNLRPWSKSNQNIQILVRMCLKSHKFLFASSFAMETLIYQSATNFDRPVNIINGDEGGHLTDMTAYSTGIQSLSSMDFYLENSTGDLYQFSNDKQEWTTKTNTGFHNTLAAQTYSTIGKFLIKAPVYRPRNNLEGPNEQKSTYISKNTECICYIKKQYIHHYAFQDMPGTKFLVQKKGKWDIHPFSFTNQDTTFITLAESDSGPLIVCYGDYIMGCEFEIIPKYFESLIPLKNFIYNKLLMISENRQSKISILDVNATISQSDVLRDIRLRSQNKNQRSLNFDKINSNKSLTPSASIQKKPQNQTFRNSGYAATKKNIGIIVQENAVGQKVVKQNQHNMNLTSRYKIQSLHQESNRNMSQSQLYNNTNRNNIESNSKVLQEYKDKLNLENNKILSASQLNLTNINTGTQSTLKQRGNSLQKLQQENNSYPNQQSSLPSFEQLLQARLQELGLGDDEEILEEEEPITKEQVRRYLHPFLSKDSLYEHNQWLPGSLKTRERNPAIRIKQNEIFKGHFHKFIKEDLSINSTINNHNNFSTGLSNLKRSSSTSHISSRKLGSSQNLNTQNMNKNLQQSNTFISNPYKSQEDIRREIEIKESAKNLGPKSLVFSVQKSRIHPQIDPNYIQNYVNLSPSKQNKNNHQYRETQKSQWISNQNFMLIV